MTEACQNWIDTFTTAHKRPPRILHVGNICNNAYQNAKMLNAQGADCDVLSIDYYHIIGAPEWEDADFTGDYGDQFFPAWHRVNLHGFVRPHWFAAGPRDVAIGYLLARRRGQAAKAQRLWRKMERARRTLAQHHGHRSLFDKLCENARTFVAYLFKSPRLLYLKLYHIMGRLDAAGYQKMRELEGSAPAIARAKADFAKAFPGKCQPFGLYLDEAAANALAYRALFNEYDLVHAYSTDPIWPYLAGAQHYVAYENGTIRYLPGETDEASNLLMLAYAKADTVMLTNTDCYESATTITQNTGTPLVYALHGLDIARMLVKMDEARQNQSFDARFGVPRDIPLFFCPSRHTWDEALGVYLKGEDAALRAAGRLAGEGFPFRLVMVNAGSDTAKIKQLAQSIPALEERVIWIDPLDKLELHTAFLHVDAVLDQFYWRVFGAITFEVLCAAQPPLLSKKVAEERMTRYFGQPLPYCACEGEDDIYAAMRWVIEKPAEAKALAAQGANWMRGCHSAEKIVQKCCEAYSHSYTQI